MSIRHALTTATVDSLNVVSSTAAAISYGVGSLEHLAALGAAHARHHRERAEESLQYDAAELKAIAENDARHRLTLRKIAHNQRMKDTEYAEAWNSITVKKSDDNSQTPAAAAK